MTDFIFYWNIYGAMLCGVLLCFDGGLFYRARGLEFVNPFWIYNSYNLNYFGTLCK